MRNFGLKVGVVGTVKFEARIKQLVDNTPDLVVLVEPLLIVRRVLREQIGILHRRLLAIVRNDAVCRRLMTVPGVGRVVALTYRATVDVPSRFRNSKAVGAVFGLTPYGLTAPSSAGPGKSQRHESGAGSNALGGNSSSTERWNDVPRGTTDEVRSYVRLDLPFS